MITRWIDWLGLVLLIVASSAELAVAQSSDPIQQIENSRRVYVPIEDLEVVIEKDKKGVILDHDRFDQLLRQAKANFEKTGPTGIAVVMSSADYVSRIAGDQLLISVTAEFHQFESGWQETRFPFQRLSLEKATINDQPALVGRNQDGSISLFTNTRGKQAIKLQLSTELTAFGSDQTAAFPLLCAPTGLLSLTLPAGKRLIVGNLQLERPAPLDQVADYQVSIGGATSMRLQITDRVADNSADSLMFATTGYGLNVAPGEVTWHAATTLQIFGKPIDRLSVSTPSSLEIADVESTGLEKWELSDDPNSPGKTLVSLTFGQTFDGKRTISFKGVMPTETGRAWMVPAIQIAGSTSQIGQITIKYESGVRLQIEESSGVRRSALSVDSEKPVTSGGSQLQASETLKFDAWQPEFVLRMTTQPKQREVQAAVASVLDVNSTGLDLQAALTVQTHFASLFELDIHLPSEWQVNSVSKDDQPLKWQVSNLDEAGLNQLRIILEPAILPETSGVIRLSLRRDVDGWPVEATPIVVNLPDLYLPQSNLTEGACVIRADDDLNLSAFELDGLDAQPLKASYERLRFQSQGSHFKGKLQITRKPSRVSVQTVTFARIDPQTTFSFLQAMVEVQGGGLRSMKVSLPDSTGTEIRFESQGTRIVEQKASPPENGRRIWTLQFEQRVHGMLALSCQIQQPLGEEREFVVPQLQFIGAERQNGFLALEAGSEQRLTAVATDANGSPMLEVDPLELPSIDYVPKERVVAVFRSLSAGPALKISEQHYDKLSVPTAVCTLLEMSSILGRTGDIQHQATFHLKTFGVQGLHVTLPGKPMLWATVVDGKPVEVRRSDDVFLIPLATFSTTETSVRTDGHHTLKLVYHTHAPEVAQFGTLIQEPPALTVESGQRTALPIEILEQKWNLHYPRETKLISGHGSLEPHQPYDTASLIGKIMTRLESPTAGEMAWQIIIVSMVIAIVAYSTSRIHSVWLSRVAAMTALVMFFALLILINATSSGPHLSSLPALAPKVAPTNKADGVQFFHLGVPQNEAAPAKAALDLPLPAIGILPGEVAQAEPEVGQKEKEGVAEFKNGVMTGDFEKQSRGLGLMSLSLDFVPPEGSQIKTFRYVGSSETSAGVPLEVDYVDQQSGAAMRVFVSALFATLGWFLRRTSLRAKIALITIGLGIPLALAPLAPIQWQVILDGTLIGTLLVTTGWIVLNGVGQSGSLVKNSGQLKAATAGLLVAIMTLDSGGLTAAELQPAPKSKKPPVKGQPPTLIIPFETGKEPLASDRVFLSHEQFLDLYRLANPDHPTDAPLPSTKGILDATYAAKLVSNIRQSGESIVRITARFAARSFTNGQQLIELPVKTVSASTAKLDGQSAPIIATGSSYQVAVTRPGLHVIDLEFDVPATLSGPTGTFTIPLLPVPVGMMTFSLPSNDLAVRVNGSSTSFRRVAVKDQQDLEIPVDQGGDISISWQPRQSQGTAAAVVHVDTVHAVMLSDSGSRIQHGFSYRVRQGGFADTSFDIPGTLRLQSVSGPDVGGWELQGEGDSRSLRVIFRRNVTDQTSVIIETFLDTRIDEGATTFSLLAVTPRDVTNEIGQVGVFAGNQFSVRPEQVESLQQIDTDKFSTSNPMNLPKSAPQLAYRFSKRPFQLTLKVSRQESIANVAAQQAAFIMERKLQLTTRLKYQLSGAPRSSLTIAVPPNFTLLDVQSSQLKDWYLSKQDQQTKLTIELNSPQIGLTELAITGTVPRDGTMAVVQFPQPVSVNKLDSTAAIWLNEGLTGILESVSGWQTVDPTMIPVEIRNVKPQKPIQFSFNSNQISPSPLSIKITQATPKLSANGLSIVTVTEMSVVYTLALQWQIDSATVDSLTLTAPAWLAGKIDFQGNELRETTETTDGERTRWTLHFRTPMTGRYFATATAALPPAGKEVLAPSLVFESEQKPISPQNQFVLLINSSSSQLSSANPAIVEPIQRDDLPVIVKKELIDQATELVRIKALQTAPKWTTQTFTAETGLPASVNIADLTTVLSRDGSYRAQAIYTIKNHSRQFLALRMPDGTELLSVLVSGQPSRAVSAKLASLNGGTAQLIALPKQSAAGLSFPVKIVWRGRLKNGLPKSASLLQKEVSVPAPQIIGQQEDADFGIPVARTRWTVYLPDHLEGYAVQSTSRHNLSLSSDEDNLYGNAVLQETDEMINYLTQTLASRIRSKASGNLKQLGLATNNLKQLGKALDSYDSRYDSDFGKQKADVMRRLSEVERLAEEESRRASAERSDSVQLKGLNAGEGLNNGLEIALEQQRELLVSNGTQGLLLADKSPDSIGFSFSLIDGSQSNDQKQASQNAPARTKIQVQSQSNETRQQLRGSNSINIDELNSEVTNNAAARQRSRSLFQSQSEQSSPSQGLHEQFFKNENGVIDNPKSAIHSKENASGKKLERMDSKASKPQSGRSSLRRNLAGDAEIEAGRQPQNNFADPKQVDHFAWGFAQKDAAGPQARNQGVDGNLTPSRKPAGGLSLDMDIPLAGKKLVFTKSGGDPKLALAVRSDQSFQRGFSLTWSIAVAGIVLSILLAVRSPSGMNRIASWWPWPLIGAGLVSYFLTPSPWKFIGFAFFLVGILAWSWTFSGKSAARGSDREI